MIGCRFPGRVFPMRLLLTALGSYGDVHPMVGLGAAMQNRGHQVQVIANPHFRAVVESAQLELVPLGTEQEYDNLAHHPDLWHCWRGPKLVLRTCMAGYLRELYALVAEHSVVGETVLGAHPLDIASRMFQEQHGTPLASIHYAPIGLRSMRESPRMFRMWLGERVPDWLKQLQYWAGDRLLVDRWLGSEVNGLRAELGLPPLSRILHRWYYSPQQIIGLFPDWYASPQPDWPARTALAGFPLWDHATASSAMELPAEVAQFLSEGEAPIVFSPGSAMTEGQAFFAAAVEACQRLRRRGILLTRYPEQLPETLPETVRYFGFVPFSKLLPQAAAFVHHGGIGSSSQGLASGRPQLVMPMAYDQLDNAVRLERLKVGATLSRRQFRGPAVARQLAQLLASRQTLDACAHWARRCDGHGALATACGLLERLSMEQP